MRKIGYDQNKLKGNHGKMENKNNIKTVNSGDMYMQINF